MNRISQLIKTVNTKESNILVKESLLKLLYNMEKYGNINLDDLELFITNLVNRDESSNCKLYTLSELAKKYITDKKPNGVSKQYLTQEIAKGNLKAIKRGRIYFIREDEVRRYLANKNIFLP